MGSNRPLGAHIAVKRLIFSTSRWWHRVQGHSYGLRYIFNALRFDIVAPVYLIEPKVPFSMEVRRGGDQGGGEAGLGVGGDEVGVGGTGWVHR